MKSIIHIIAIIVLSSFLYSCYVQHPRYSLIDDIVKLDTNIELDSVSSLLGCEPYDFISLDTSGTKIVLYKYRVKEIRRVPVIMKKSKGIEVTGKWKDLLVTLSPDGKVISYSTTKEELPSKTIEKKVDPNKVLQAITTTITVLLPAVLVYLSVQ